MSTLERTAMLLTVLLLCTEANAQVQPPPKEARATASISGRITIDGAPSPGITVVLKPESSLDRPTGATATTDENGRYQLTGRVVGRFRVVPIISVPIVWSDPWFRRAGKSVTIAEGEGIEGIDFALARGGVITGQVIDADGRPVIEERITLTQIDENGGKQHYSLDQSLSETDDRGVYRIYGLPAGRYIVSVGGYGESGTIRTARSDYSYSRTFHPATTDEAQAKIIDLAAGSEMTDVNIKLGQTIRTYVIAGRLVEAETGRAVPNVPFNYGQLGENSRLLRGLGGSHSDGKGEFRIESLSPGRYTIFAMSEDQSGFYSDPVTVEVRHENINGLEIKLLRGATISGRAVIEGANEPAVLGMLPQLGVMTFPSVPGILSSGQPAQSWFGADGSFRISGLREGKAQLTLTSRSTMKGFSLLRIERGGVEQSGGIQLTPDEQATDVRLVIAYSTGIVRGQVKVEGGALPDGARMTIFSRGTSPGTPSNGPSAEVDSRGQFVLEGMAVGNHELTLHVFSSNHSSRIPSRSQTITVEKGKECTPLFVLNLGNEAK